MHHVLRFTLIMVNHYFFFFFISVGDAVACCDSFLCYLLCLDKRHSPHFSVFVYGVKPFFLGLPLYRIPWIYTSMHSNICKTVLFHPRDVFKIANLTISFLNLRFLLISLLLILSHLVAPIITNSSSDFPGYPGSKPGTG